MSRVPGAGLDAEGVAGALVVLTGRAGVGKTTIARLLAQALGAAYLRIDTIEQALVAGGMTDPGASGYAVAYRMAADNLRLGRCVVADAVNPLGIVRDAWAEVAFEAGGTLHLVELVCSDPVEHRRRVESRAADIPGHVLPTWEAVLQRPFEPVTGARCVLDTAVLAPEQAVAAIVAALPTVSPRPAAEG